VKRLLLVRHGESEWNAVRRLQGQADIDLSEKGRQQAIALKATIAALSPDRVLTSDLKRARDTAALLGFSNAELTTGLREINVGDWTAANIPEIVERERDNYRGWRAGTFVPPGGEAWPDFVARTEAAVRSALEGSERLLAVCHGGVIRALLQSLIGLGPQKILPVGPASLSILKFDSAQDVRLELFNYRPDGPALDAPD
jgi:glucosyl-3-phosphoglycerate phosphatase